MTPDEKKELALKIRIKKMREQVAAQQVAPASPAPVATTPTATPVAAALPPTAKPPVAKPAGPTRLNFRKMMEDRANLGNTSGGDFLSVSKLAEGQHKFRFIMHATSDLFYAFRRSVWMKVVDDKGEPHNEKVISPLTVDPDTYCPCSRLSRALKILSKETTGAASKRAAALSNDLYPKSEFMSNVLMLNPATNAWEPHILVYGMTVYKSLVDSQQANVDAEDVDAKGYLKPEATFTDPKHGRIAVIKKTGQQRDTRYSATITKARAVTTEELATASDLSQFTIPNDVQDTEAMLVEQYNAPDFETLVGNIADIALPESSYESKDSGGATTAPPTAPQPNTVQEETEASSELPTCVGSFGTPAAGFICEACPVNADCMEISDLT